MITTVLSWNVGPRRRFRGLARDLRQLIGPEDDVVALFEMSQRNTRLLRAASPRWRVLRPTVGRGRRRTDVVVMIRRSLAMPTVAVLAHNVPWVGPKAGRAHRGRAHLQLTWGKEDRLVLVHRVPGGPTGGVNARTRGNNLRAWLADRALIEKAVSWPGNVAVIGDQNATAEEMREEYEPLGLTPCITNTKVDHAATWGYPMCQGRRLANLGSDHPAVRWRLR